MLSLSNFYPTLTLNRCLDRSLYLSASHIFWTISMLLKKLKIHATLYPSFFKISQWCKSGYIGIAPNFERFEAGPSLGKQVLPSVRVHKIYFCLCEASESFWDGLTCSLMKYIKDKNDSSTGEPNLNYHSQSTGGKVIPWGYESWSAPQTLNWTSLCVRTLCTFNYTLDFFPAKSSVNSFKQSCTRSNLSQTRWMMRKEFPTDTETLLNNMGILHKIPTRYTQSQQDWSNI